MSKLDELRSDLASVLLDVKPLALKGNEGTLTAEEDARFDELTKRVNEIKNDIVKAETTANAVKEVLELDKLYNRPANDDIKRGLHDNDPQAREKAINALKSPGRKFVESAQFLDSLKRGSGNMGSRDNGVKFDGFFGPGPDGEKAVVNSGTAGASYLFNQVLPGIYRPLEAPLQMRDVLLNMRTTSDGLTVMQENVFTNNAAEVAEATANNGAGLTGGVKPITDITFTEASFPVRWIAHYVEITRQMLQDLAFMEDYINQRLITGLKRREDNQFLNGNGTPPNLTGILQTAGIQSLTTAGEFTSSPVANAGAAPENLDRLRRGIRKIRWTGLAEPTFIVLNPADAEVIDTLTDTTKQYLIGGPLAPAQRRLWGLPVVESANIAAKTALIGDGTMAAVVDRMDATIYTTDSHADYFIRNIFVILAEERVALPVFRPAAFASVQLV